MNETINYNEMIINICWNLQISEYVVVMMI